MRRILLLFLISGLCTSIIAQISKSGTPPGLIEYAGSAISVKDLSTPSLQTLLREDDSNGKNGTPERVGIAIEVNTDILEEGAWSILSDGSRICRLRINAPGATAMAAYFNDFRIPTGGNLFLYDPEGETILGAFTEDNNKAHRLFATQLIPGDAIIIEYHQPVYVTSAASLVLDNIAFHYKMLNLEIFGRSSDHCEVNINCSPEGDNWQNQKRGVARVYVKQLSSYFWCSGSLMNNARRDWTPYFLTANHCGEQATEDDYHQWVFDFQYETEGCEDPPGSADFKSMTGATVVSKFGESGSDFKLLLLQDDVPDDYDPYYNGWDRSGAGSNTGVSIHHPSGDVKKISTYTTPLVSDTWNGSPGTHWKVVWSDTPNGHGVTEGGSSGAPIFNSGGLILGSESGGRASCDPGSGGPGTGPDKPDYYGKVSYSWESNGNSPEERLKDWLDPDDTGIESIRGMNNHLTADFEAVPRVILTGQTIEYLDMSSGTPTSYEWIFEGGDPATSNSKDPGPVKYDVGGSYDVTLIVSSSAGTHTLYRPDYIEVSGRAYPNPASTSFTVYVGEEPVTYSLVELFDITGRLVINQKIYNENGFQLIEVDVSTLSNGIYLIRLTSNQLFTIQKVMVQH